MSLITLNSNGQKPNFFSTHFPQAISIPPRSQVCLLKMIHFRDTTVYNVTRSNNTIRYCLGTNAPNSEMFRTARVETGEYTGTQLAVKIAEALNNVNQQQNFKFSCTFTPEDDTTSPPTVASFSISYASEPNPTQNQGDQFTLGVGGMSINGLLNVEGIELKNEDNFTKLIVDGDLKETDMSDRDTFLPASNAVVNDRGILMHLGQYITQDIFFSGFLLNQFGNQAGLTANLCGFDNLNMGLCRNELCFITNENPNVNLLPTEQDVSINFGAQGITISSIKGGAGNPSYGSPNYQNQKVCRVLPKAFFKDLIESDIFAPALTLNDMPNICFKFQITTSGIGKRIYIQMFISKNGGINYIPIPDGKGGNDAAGNPFVGTGQALTTATFPSCIWQSDKAEFNDVIAGTNQRVQNLLSSRKAPFKPTFSLGEPPKFPSYFDLSEPDLNYRDKAQAALDNYITFNVIDYTGDHGYDFEASLSDEPAVKYYIMSAYTRSQITTQAAQFKALTQRKLYYVSFADAAIADNDADTLEVDLINGEITAKLPSHPTAARQADFLIEPSATLDAPEGATTTAIPDYVYYTIGGGAVNRIDEKVKFEIPIDGNENPDFRPISLNDTAEPNTSFQLDEAQAVAKLHSENDFKVAALPNNDVGSGADDEVTRKFTLLLKSLTEADVTANAGSPANLSLGFPSGTMGQILGSVENVLVYTTASEGQQVFQSNMPTQKISKDSILQVSIPEFSGVKSFQGIDQSSGRNLSGEGKVLAVLPREEFSSVGENTNHSLVYVAPFENWIDINNIIELNINQLTVDIRQPSGVLASDLRPDTIVQLKLREDPRYRDIQEKTNQYEDLVLAISSGIRSGQILSTNILNKGS
tara:strand:- start:69 stop:2678 length:2610 start_codon:yes stop_codon:yes gene_type:complete